MQYKITDISWQGLSEEEQNKKGLPSECTIEAESKAEIFLSLEKKYKAEVGSYAIVQEKEKNSMPKFKVEITETLQRVVEIEAESANEAVQKVSSMYDEQEIVLDSSDFVGSDIEIYTQKPTYNFTDIVWKKSDKTLPSLYIVEADNETEALLKLEKNFDASVSRYQCKEVLL